MKMNKKKEPQGLQSLKLYNTKVMQYRSDIFAIII